MKKRILIIAIPATIILGLTIFLIATRESDKDHVETLHRQIPEVAQFITGNKEAFSLLLEIKDRVNEFNAIPSGDGRLAIRSYTLDMRTDSVRIYLGSGGLSSQPTREVMHGDEADFLSAADRKVLLDALSRYSVIIYPDRISVQMSESGLALLYAMHPHSAANWYDGQGDQDYWCSPLNSNDYSCYEYYRIIDENWLVMIFNEPRG